MKWILIIFLIPILGYVLLISCAGLGVLVAERRFKNSPYREDILSLIEDTWAKISTMPKNEIELLERNGLRECVSRASQDYSVDVIVKRKDGGYDVMISAGILKPITFGHTETYWLPVEADA